MAVTEAQKNTAIKIAKPSTQALLFSSAGAVPTSRAIEKIAATINILMVKSSRASQKSWMSPAGSVVAC